MESYTEYYDRRNRTYNEFVDKYMFFAFNEVQFNEGMRKLGLDPGDTGRIYRTAAGGFILKEHSGEHKALLKKLDEELKENMRDFDFAVDAFLSELANHEYCITYDYEDALMALGLTLKDVAGNSMLVSALRHAERKYLDCCENH